MGNAYDIIGLIGSFVISAGLVPQVQKVFRTKSADDISYSFISMYVAGLAMVVIYGFGEALWPIYIPASLELLGVVALFAMKFKYDGGPRTVDPETAQVEKEASVSLSPNGGRFGAVLTPR